MMLRAGMRAQTEAGPALVMFVGFDDHGEMDEIVMKLDKPNHGYSFVVFASAPWPTLHMVQ